MIDRERRRSCAPDDHQEPPHRGRIHKTEDPDRCSDVPSSPVSNEICRQKTESLFAKTLKSLLQQNLPKADIHWGSWHVHYVPEAVVAGRCMLDPLPIFAHQGSTTRR